jgi:TRAP-type C4-dicarboxylate transport system permease small subunit
MKKVLDWAEKFIDNFSTVLVAVSLAAICLQVFFRYVMGNATTWSDSVAATSLAWMTFLAGTAAVRTNENMATDFLVNRFGPTGQKVCRVFAQFMTLLFALALGYSGLMLMQATSTSVVEGLLWEVTWSQLYFITIFCALFMAIFSIEKLFTSESPIDQKKDAK